MGSLFSVLCWATIIYGMFVGEDILHYFMALSLIGFPLLHTIIITIRFSFMLFRCDNCNHKFKVKWF